MQELSLSNRMYISAKLWLSIITLMLVAGMLAVDEHIAYADQTPPTDHTALLKGGPKPVAGKLPNTEPGHIDQWMPNKRLQQSLLYQLNAQVKEDQVPLHWQDVSEISQLDMQFLGRIDVDGRRDANHVSTYIDGRQEFSIEGLQYAQNATFVNFSGGDYYHPPYALFGDLVDISPLSKMPEIETMYLDFNRIEDVSPLAGLKNLTYLSIVNNHVKDFSSLKPIQSAVKDYRYQHVTLDKIGIDPDERWAHLENNFRLPNGELVDMAIRPYSKIAYFYDLPGSGHEKARNLIYMNIDIDHIYYDDAGTGLEYWYIPDQEPGLTEFEGFHVIPQADKNFLLAEGQDETGVDIFDIVQPYQIGQLAAGQVTVHYHDEQGKSIAPDQTLPVGKVGEAYTTHPVEVAGYKLLHESANAKGVYTTQDVDVTYTYGKQSAIVTPPTLPKPATPQPELPGKPTAPGIAHTTQATVTVRYVDQQGKKLHADVNLHGRVGEPYKADAVAVKGYMLYDVPKNIKGVFLEQPQMVTYVYQTETVPNDDVGTVVTSGAAASVSGSSPVKKRPGRPIHAAPRQPARRAVARRPVQANRSVAKAAQQASAQQPDSEQKPSTAIQHHGGAAAKATAPKRTAFHKHYFWQSFLFWWLILGMIIGFWFFLVCRRRRKKEEED